MDLLTELPAIYTASTEEVLERIVSEGPAETSTNILDLDEIVRNVHCWKEAHPDLIPFYSPCVNNHPTVLTVLANLDVGFSCASREEMRSVLDLGVTPTRVRLTHPCKTPDTILYAMQRQVRRILCDSVQEVAKVHRLYPTAQIILRVRLSPDQKFGCSPQYDAPEVFNFALSTQVSLVGVHVAIPQGTQLDPLEWLRRGLQEAKATMEHAHGLGLSDLQELMLSPPENVPSHLLRSSLAAVGFPSRFACVIETERALVESAVTLVTNVQSKRVIRHAGTSNHVQEIMYFLNDGRYGSFEWWNTIDKAPKVIRMNGTVPPVGTMSWPSSLWGPTCDSADIICERLDLPELEVGDFLIFPAMGAYGVTLASRFNGFPVPKTVVSARQASTRALLGDRLKTVDSGHPHSHDLIELNVVK